MLTIYGTHFLTYNRTCIGSQISWTLTNERDDEMCTTSLQNRFIDIIEVFPVA